MIPHQLSALDAEARTGIAGRGPAFRKLLQLGIVGGHVDLNGDELVAALAVLGDETAPLETEDLSRGRPLRNGEHDWSVWCRHPDLGTQHRLLESHRQLEPNVGALARVEAVRRDLDCHNRVA